MKLGLNINTKQWLIKTPLQSSTDGWSDWTKISRMEALSYIEAGWNFDVLTYS